jgi:hypothetical protein
LGFFVFARLQDGLRGLLVVVVVVVVVVGTGTGE